MTHNELSFIEDVIRPMLGFLRDHKLLSQYFQMTRFAPTKQVPSLINKNSVE